LKTNEFFKLLVLSTALSIRASPTIEGTNRSESQHFVARQRYANGNSALSAFSSFGRSGTEHDVAREPINRCQCSVFGDFWNPVA
jgi:hypothetical protein